MRSGYKTQKRTRSVSEGIGKSSVELSLAHADLQVEYGPQQTFNPVRFDPPTEPFQPDPQTLLLMQFDDDWKASVPEQLPEARRAE